MTMTRTAIKTFTRTFIKDEDGATAIEYALMAALIGGVIVASVAALGTSTSDSFTDLKDTLDDPSSATTTSES
jgi:pilus assembly protein Flp/PilA